MIVLEERTVVAIGSSRDRDYSFLLPITCLMWRDRIGFRPLALLAGGEGDWRGLPRTAVALEALRRHGIDHEFVGLAEGYPEHTTAQNCRQHASALSKIDAYDWVMPADADLWPLRREFYHRHEGSDYKAVSLYANGDHFQGKETTLARSAQGLGTQTIPTCHVAMRAGDWRSIYQPIADDVSGSIKKTLDAWMPTRVAVPGYDLGFHLWMSDQQIMTVALCQQPWFPSQVFFVDRHGHPPVDRLCRSVVPWERPFDPSKWVDVHLHKAPESDAHWPDALAIVEAVLPQHAEWAKRYREDYSEASK